MLQPRSMAAVEALVAKGVDIPNPWTIDIAPEVDLDRISGEGVVLHPGTRLRGATTLISAGSELGREGPVTIEECRLGRGVALKGGYAARAVFLDGANLALGHHVREGTLLEEEANGAHCVGLKQTILFPFVTLGSLINFCDCLMAGGTSRKDHSEVGSSYIHFNFTPAGDKTTPSLFGDVARGVMLRERPIFLGGQGGAVGPVQTAYGSVVGAGSILRSDVRDEDTLTIVGGPPTMSQLFSPTDYRSLNRIVAKNVTYLANLDALERWYLDVRSAFARDEFATAVHEGALDMVQRARAERQARLLTLTRKLPGDTSSQRDLVAAAEDLTGLFGTSGLPAADPAFLDCVSRAASGGQSYIEAIRGLDEGAVAQGSTWLRSIVDTRWDAVGALLPALSRLRGR